MSIAQYKIRIPIYALSLCIALFFLSNSPTLGIRFYLPVFLPVLVIGSLYFLKKKIKIQFMHFTVLVFFLISILHLGTSVEHFGYKNTSIIAQPLIFAFMFVFSSFSLNKRELKRIVDSFICAGTGFSIYLFLFHLPMGAGHFSIRTLWGPYDYIDPNYLSAFMVVPSIILLKRALFTHQNIGTIVLAVINILATVLTGSRAALLALVISTVLLMFANWNIKTCLSLIGLVLLGYIVSIIMFDTDLIERLFVRSYVDEGNVNRLFLWKQSIYYTLQNNPMFGSGLVSVSLVIDSTSHNSFLAIFMAFGIVGFLFWCMLMYKILIGLLHKDLYLFLSIYIGFIFVYSMIPGDISFGFWLILLLLIMVIRFHQENPNVELWKLL